MNTQSHVLIGAALFGGKLPKKAWLAALGGLLPDVPMFVIFAWAKLSGISTFYVLTFLYFQNWWQIINGISHNFWLWGAALIASIAMRERRSISAAAIDGWAMAVAFAASGLLHSAIDFLCHREDAHMHFWPLTRWTFVSPVSYWDPSHYGHIFGLFEAAAGLVSAVILFRRFHNWLVRALLAIAALIYVALPVYFAAA